MSLDLEKEKAKIVLENHEYADTKALLDKVGCEILK